MREDVKEHRLGIISAGVAFYAFLSLFPALTAIISIWGLFSDPAQVQQQIASLQGVAPSSAVDLIEGAASQIAASSSASLGWGLALSLLITLWSANRGMKSLIDALNITNDERDERGFVTKNAISLAMTLGAIIATILAIAMVVAVPALLAYVGLGAAAEWAIRLGRWPALAGLLILALAVVYRLGPDRSQAKWRWVSTGSLVATGLWLVASTLFSIYVKNFSNYNETYGSLAAVAILLMWFFVSSFIVLLGSEINAESEKQTARDTTKGPDQPLGERGAVPADTVADRPSIH